MSEVKNKQEEVVQPKVKNESKTIVIISAPGFICNPATDGVNSEAAILINYEEKKAIICGSQYSGEIKKTVFSTYPG